MEAVFTGLRPVEKLRKDLFDDGEVDLRPAAGRPRRRAALAP